GDEVDRLDAGLEHFRLGALLGELGRITMNRPARHVLCDSALAVNRIADHIEKAPERFLADRNRHRRAGCRRLDAARKARGVLKRDRAYAIKAYVLCDLQGDMPAIV